MTPVMIVLGLRRRMSASRTYNVPVRSSRKSEIIAVSSAPRPALPRLGSHAPYKRCSGSSIRACIDSAPSGWGGRSQRSAFVACRKSAKPRKPAPVCPRWTDTGAGPSEKEGKRRNVEMTQLPSLKLSSEDSPQSRRERREERKELGVRSQGLGDLKPSSPPSMP